jgi:serine/threonine-protein kinase
VDLLLERNRENEFLNAELRRQIAARSSELADALAALEKSPAAVRPLAPGERVMERYEVIAAIGAGAAGTVYKVRRLSDATILALKRVTRSTDAMTVARLAREAQLVATVRHPNVVDIVDVDIATYGWVFMVMELVEGQPLRKARARYGDVPWALGVLAQIAAGLEAVHAAGIVHRDLKPSNVLLDGEVAKLADFGISALAAARPTDPEKTLQDDKEALTETGALLGTPLYMAPEALRGAEHVTAASDVFAFGVIAFELVTGKLPFGELPAAVRMTSRSQPPPPSLRPTLLPDEIADLFERCMATHPAARPTAHELRVALDRRQAERGDGK